MILPDKDLLLAAFRGFPHRDHPVLDAAGELAVLHEHRLRSRTTSFDNFERDRARLVLEIDRWCARHLPVPPGGARLHTETVGRVVDRLARMSAQVYSRLVQVSDSEYERATTLNELADAYQDLVDELSCGMRRLPDTSDR